MSTFTLLWTKVPPKNVFNIFLQLRLPAVWTELCRWAAQRSHVWRIRPATLTACMRSATPSSTLLQFLIQRYKRSLSWTLYLANPNYAFLLSVCFAMQAEPWMQVMFVFSRVRRLWKRASSASPTVSPPRSSRPSNAVPPSRRWLLKCRRNATRSLTSAMWPDPTLRPSETWSRCPATSQTGNTWLACAIGAYLKGIVDAN